MKERVFRVMLKKPFWVFLFIVLCLSGCVKKVHGEGDRRERIKVLLFKGVNEVAINDGRGEKIAVSKDRHGRVRINGRERELPVRLHLKGEFIYINGKPFRGALELAESKHGLLVINEVDLESYLISTIPNEVSSKWDDDVLKAQAVIARTYALWSRVKRAKEPYHLEGSIMGQVYSGVDSEDSAASRAVKATAGEVLTFGGEPALTVYHSNAAGRTDSSKNIWARYYPYLESVGSPYDSSDPNFKWGYSIPARSLMELLSKKGFKTGSPEEAVIESVTDAGRVMLLSFRDSDGKKASISGEDLRKLVGYTNIKSTVFEVKRKGEAFEFEGRGAGHGVGLSQWGAKGMADEGYSYRQILKHYYPGTELEKIY